MGVARRLYLYAVSSFSLLVLAAGLYNLVALVFGEAADALGSSFLGGGADVGREQVSLAIALVVVGAPLFAIHWSLVGRGWRGDDASGREDRHSSIRAFHLALVATVALVFAVFAAYEVFDKAFGTIFGIDGSYGPRISDALATLVVATPIWGYHQWRRGLDLRHDRLTDAPAWLTRFHRYAWAFAGLMLLVFGTSQVLQSLASQVVDRQDFGTDSDAWIGPLAASLSWIVVGSIVFWSHAMDARRTIRDAAIIGEDDRATALRAAYFGGVILVCIGLVAVSVAAGLTELGRFGMGTGDALGPGDLLELAVGPLLVAIPFAITGWLHWGAQRREAAQRSSAALAGAERLGLHLTTLAGITFLAFGSAQLLGRLFEIALGGTTVDEFLRNELAWYVAQVIVGAVLWIPAWTAILRRRAADPVVDRRAAASRVYLYLIVGVAVVAAVPSAAFVLFRLIDRVLGGSGSDLSSELAIPVAVLIVASLIATYHGRLALADLRFASTETDRETARAATNDRITTDMAAGGAVAAGAETGVGGAAIPAASAVPAGATLQGAVGGVAISLTLRATDGTNLEDLVAHLRADLPPGVTLERGES